MATRDDRTVSDVLTRVSPAPLQAAVGKHDWATTPLGPINRWPQSLRTATDMMLASGHAMCLCWGPDRTLLYNDAYAPMLGERHPDALGLQMREAWPDVWDEIEPLVERAMAGETVTFRDMPLVMTRNGYPEDTWWTFSYSPVRDEQGDVAGFLNVTLETTAGIIAERQRSASAAALRESEEFTRTVLESSTDCIKVLGLDGSLEFMSHGGQRVMEIDDFTIVRGCGWPSLIGEKESALAVAAIEAAKRGETSHFECEANTNAGTPKWWSISVSPVYDGDGRVVRILSVSRDHTELRDARERQELLNGELSHRLKNTLSVIQAIAFQTLSDAGNQEAVAAFGERLAALSKAHDVLTRQSWSAADIGEVVRGVLATFDEGGRISISGPSTMIGPRATLSLSLLLHELATNAIKHGSLSAPEGRVMLGWSWNEDKSGIVMRWEERSGPPAVEPSRRGFGSRIIRMGLAGSGGTTLHYG